MDLPRVPIHRYMSPAPDAERLRSIIAVASEIAATRLELDAIMHLVAERATALTGAKAGAVELTEENGVPGLAVLGSLAGLAVSLGQPLHCDDAFSDERVNAEACRQVDVRSIICVPLRHREETVGVLKVMSPEAHAFDDGDVETLGLLSGLVAAHLTNATVLEEARRDHYVDALTDLPGQRAFETALRGEVARASRYGLRLSLALLDVDRLERLNELHGREAGDAVLLRVAEVLRGVRASDMAFRVGEDEFAVLLPNTPYHAARTAAERAAADVGPCGLPAGRVNVSVGVAEARSADPPGLLAAAHGSLTRAKERRPGGLRAA